MDAADASAKAEKKQLAEQKKAEKQEKKEAREKKAADKAEKADKPKKAKSAYMLFADDVRDGIMNDMKAKSGKVDMGAMAKVIAERWAKLEEADKSKYQEQASKGKEKADEEMKAYKEKKDPVGALKEKYADLIPKKPTSAYWIFQTDEASRQKATGAAGKDASHKEITAKLGEIWRGMSADDKAPFEKRVQAAQKEYEEKLKVWQATPQFAELAKLEGEQKAAEKEQKAVEKAADKAPPSPNNSPSKKRNAAKEAKAAKAAKIARMEEVAIDEATLKKAQSLGLESNLKILATRSDIIANGISHGKILSALQDSDGLVHKTRAVLLGA